MIDGNILGFQYIYTEKKNEGENAISPGRKKNYIQVMEYDIIFMKLRTHTNQPTNTFSLLCVLSLSSLTDNLWVEGKKGGR